MAGVNDTLLLHGYWGTPTSTVDWCEDNYVWSYYIAEWWNSWSNVPPLLLALYALYKSRLAYANDAQPMIIRYAYIVPLVIFSGSFAFHSTLTYAGQLLDELPMMYGTLYFHYISLRYHATMKWVLVAFAVGLTIALSIAGHAPLAFQSAYGFLTVALVVRSVVMHKQHKDVSQTRLLHLGSLLYAAGFVLWIADQAFCPSAKQLHLHAIWHLLSGAGTFVWIQFACAYELSMHEKRLHVQKIACILPYCSRSSAPSTSSTHPTFVLRELVHI
ncbi:hypothetical protein SPRG_11702 [Saprolegnia parasitica CBS 223.65]|uniref:Alkaline ceramidase 3 n=1 Tax=Saprolegnia parasitica (strain CBS 223.65) TaxID=695850 RepID=A0A067BW57_SAPPC|nr:hypothetical protein SPRG_11702 [Saprolegnia parasitica CBS 223.65]KDO22518.1 hypothetical protein SPRG_11702 [Saprolegnia parasitica CBS 223.65]|eukprot:XP_012206766.1 hypothetical protein SPRG_11702 [Saprolegnia parasitica CBS 223.65]